MNMFAKFDEIPAMTLPDIKETTRYGWTHGHTHARTDRHRENSTPQTKFAGWISRNNFKHFCFDEKLKGHANLVEQEKRGC